MRPIMVTIKAWAGLFVDLIYSIRLFFYDVKLVLSSIIEDCITYWTLCGILGIIILTIVAFLNALIMVGWAPALSLLFVLVAQKTSVDSGLCMSREMEECGIIGNSDSYGLGIRIGIYLQWLASFLANHFVPVEGRGLWGAHLVFSFALFVTLFVLTFRKACTFVLEIIILLYIYLGGLYHVMLPYYSRPENLAMVRKDTTRSKHLFEMGNWMVFLYLAAPVQLLAAWFWVSMAKGTLAPFSESPCGTSFFLFTRVTPPYFRLASAFMAIFPLLLSTVTFCATFWAAIVQCIKRISPSPRFEDVAARVDYGIQRWTIGVLARMYTTTSRAAVIRCIILFRLHGNPWSFRMPPGLTPDPLDLVQIDKVGVSFLSMAIFLWMVIAVELTLVWNSVSGVYELNSAGQFIPLAIGLGGIIQILWKILGTRKWAMRYDESETGSSNQADPFETAAREERGTNMVQDRVKLGRRWSA